MRAVTAAGSLLLALLAAGCVETATEDRTPHIISLEKILSRPPDAVRGEIKVWGAPPRGGRSVFYMEVPRALTMGYNMSGPVTFFIADGIAELRVGARTETLGAGSFADVPRRMAFRIRNKGDKRLVVACLHASYERFQWHPHQAPLTPVR